MTMTIKAGRFPGRIDEYAVEVGTTVAEVLAMAGIETGTDAEIKLNGETVAADEVVKGNDIVLVTKKIKGNSMNTIKVGRFPGRINEFVVETGTTVEQALQLAEIELGTDGEVKVNGIEYTPCSLVKDGDVVLVTKKIKGNR